MLKFRVVPRRFRGIFLTEGNGLAEESESPRSVVHSAEKQCDCTVENGKIPVQGRVENYATA